MIRCDMVGGMGWGQDEKAFRNGCDLRGVQEDLGWKKRSGHQIRCLRCPRFDAACL